MNFIGLNQAALKFLEITARPAKRVVTIEYEDGTSKIISSYKFLEIIYEPRKSKTSDLYPLTAYYKDDVLLYEERVQCSHQKFIFTALWDIQNKNWIQISLWDDNEIQASLNEASY
jgi:hypothetical protein